MFDLNIENDSFILSNVEKDDMEDILKLLNKIKVHNYINKLAFEYPVKEVLIKEEYFKERFIEYYMSECEYFSKIYYNKILVGIIKGRIEFKNENEDWIGELLIEESFRGLGIGKSVMKLVTGYLNEEFEIKRYYTKVNIKNKELMSFWKSIGFKTVKKIDISSYNNDSMVLLERCI